MREQKSDQTKSQQRILVVYAGVKSRIYLGSRNWDDVANMGRRQGDKEYFPPKVRLDSCWSHFTPSSSEIG